VRKNATFARYLGAILCNLKQKKMYSSEFCVRFADIFTSLKGIMYVVFLKHTPCVFD